MLVYAVLVCATQLGFCTYLPTTFFGNREPSPRTAPIVFEDMKTCQQWLRGLKPSPDPVKKWVECRPVYLEPLLTQMTQPLYMEDRDWIPQK